MVHLVAIQFGIFVGILGCLVFSRFESAKPRAAAKERTAERTAAVEPLSEQEDQPADRVDYPADPKRAQPMTEQPIPVVENQYSPAAVERYRTLAAQLYYQQIAPRRNASATLTTSSTAAVAPSYTDVAQEPAVLQADDPAPQTVAYVQPTQVVVYPQSQFVVFSNRRPVANRCRPTPHRGTLTSNPRRRPDGRGTHLIGSTGFESPTRSFGAVHRRNTGVPSCPPSKGSNHRRR